MIAANVAAARALEAKKAPVMYRVHESAEPREAGRAEGLSRDLRPRIRARPGGQAEHLQPDHRAGRRFRPGARRSWSSCCAPRCRRATGPSGSATSGWRWRPTPTSPRRSAAMPTCSSTARWSAPTSSATAACRRARTSASIEIGEQISMLERRAMEAERDTDRPLCRRLPRRPGRAAGRVPHHRRPAVRLLRHGRGSRRRRAGPRPDARPGIFPLRRSGAAAGRRRDRRDLSRRPAADAPARRGQSGLGLAAFRASRGQLRRRTSCAQRQDRVRGGGRRGRPANIRHDHRRR